MDKILLKEAGHLATTLMIMADRTGDPRIRRLADKACDREHRRWQKWDKEQAELRQVEPLPPRNHKGKPDTQDRPRAGVWRRRYR